MILSLQSTTFGAHGGIPTYNRLVCRVLNELALSNESHVFLVTDTPNDLAPYHREFPNITFTAFSGRRAAFVWAVIRLVLKQKIDLLLIGHVNYAPLGLLLSFLQPSLRYGVMVHGIDVWARLPFIKRLALQRADFVSSVSEYTKQQVVSVNQVDPQRVYLLPNALEWKECGAPAQINSETATRLLSVCRLSVDERYKGVDTVIESLPLVLSSVPDVEYFVVGSGTDLERHKQLAEKLSLTDRVHFLGSVDVETLQAQYRACDIFVMPSAGEGFGIVFLEAMAYSKAVVAADSRAVAEVVKDGITGALVQYGNCEQLAAAIIRLSSNAELRQSLGKAGFERLQKNFSFERFQQRFQEILDQQKTDRTVNASKRSRMRTASL